MQPDAEAPIKRLTWGHCLSVCFVLLIVGTLLSLWNPIWIAPPNFGSTLFIYCGAMWLWVPVLFVYTLRSPKGSMKFAALGITFTTIVSLILSVFVLRKLFFIPLIFILHGGSNPCSSNYVAPNIVQYTCTASYGPISLGSSRLASYTITFEGIPNFTLVRLTGEVEEPFR
jgi:hypothetical protein